jgi:hypothetical protein
VLAKTKLSAPVQNSVQAADAAQQKAGPVLLSSRKLEQAYRPSIAAIHTFYGYADITVAPKVQGKLVDAGTEVTVSQTPGWKPHLDSRLLALDV